MLVSPFDIVILQTLCKDNQLIVLFDNFLLNKILKNFHLDELDFLNSLHHTLIFLYALAQGYWILLFFLKEEEILVSISKMS